MEIENAFLVKTSHLLCTLYLACHIAWRGILDGKNFGEALSRVEGLYKGIPHYLPFWIQQITQKKYHVLIPTQIPQLYDCCCEHHSYLPAMNPPFA